MPLFSIVIPAYNYANYITQTLESVYTQTCKDYEIIVVDDGSKDNTLEVLRPHAHRARIITQPNQGLPATRTNGAKAATGEYVVFLDSDDVLLPWALESFERAILEHNRPPMVSGDWKQFKENSDIKAISRGSFATRYFADYLSTGATQTSVAPSASIVNREVFLAAGGNSADCPFFDDVEVWMRVGSSPGYAHIDSPTVMAYRIGHTSMSRSMKRTLDGFRWIIRRVEEGKFPSGTARKREMQDILAMHSRGASFRALEARDTKVAWTIYKESWYWNLRLGRVRYLAGFPLFWLGAILRGKPK